jgi:hypothetical protein
MGRTSRLNSSLSEAAAEACAATASNSAVVMRVAASMAQIKCCDLIQSRYVVAQASRFSSDPPPLSGENI